MNKKKKLRSLILITLYLLLCFAVCYMLLLCKTESHAQTALMLAVLVTGFFFAFLFSVIIHETGHLIFGLLTGYRFVSFRIAKWMIVKETGKCRIRRLSTPGIAGQCLMAPPPKKDGKFPYLLYNFGGVIFGGLVSVTALVCAFFLVHISYPLYMVSWITGCFGIFMNLANAIPTSGKNSSNDGTNARSARKSAFTREALWNQLQYTALLSEGIRVSEMPEELFVLPPSAELTNALAVCEGMMCLDRAVDRGDYEKAEETARYLLTHAIVLHPLYRASLVTDLLYFELIREHREDEIHRLHDDFLKDSPLIKHNLSAFRTRYAYALLIEKDNTAAEQALAAFEKYAASHPHQTVVQTERILIEYAQNLSKNRKESPICLPQESKESQTSPSQER